jgi:hypothetical protein
MVCPSNPKYGSKVSLTGDILMSVSNKRKQTEFNPFTNLMQ